VAVPRRRPEPVVTTDIDPRVCDILAQAEREHYRITACTDCGGPEIHAKTKPAAKCFRCGRYRTLERVTLAPTRQRCCRCKQTFHAVLKTRNCDKCRGKRSQEPEIDQLVIQRQSA
jgi:hypothetical protein